jgi:hypothetical protein
MCFTMRLGKSSTSRKMWRSYPGAPFSRGTSCSERGKPLADAAAPPVPPFPQLLWFY